MRSDWRFCRHAVGQLDVTHVNRIANVERGNVHRDFIRQIARQTFHRQNAQALLEQSAKILHAIRYTRRLERNIGLDFFVHRNGMEIDVQNIAAHGEC